MALITKHKSAIEIGNNMKILMVLTSHDKLGNTGRKTGFWLEEFAAPDYEPDHKLYTP